MSNLCPQHQLQWPVTHRGERGHQEVVDDVAGEEEGVDEASVLVPEGLRGDGGLGGVGACDY